MINRLVKRLNPVHRYGPCWGLTLWRWRRFKIELWWAPSWFSPPEHTHENSDGEFFILWAKKRVIYRIVDKMVQSYKANVPPWGRCLSVRAGTPHTFKGGASPMVWLVFERWKAGAPITSVADDFRLT